MPKCRDPWGREPGAGPRLCFAVTFPPLANALARGRAEPDNFHLPMSPGFVLRTASFELPARVLPILSRCVCVAARLAGVRDLEHAGHKLCDAVGAVALPLNPPQLDRLHHSKR